MGFFLPELAKDGNQIVYSSRANNSETSFNQKNKAGLISRNLSLRKASTNTQYKQFSMQQEDGLCLQVCTPHYNKLRSLIDTTDYNLYADINKSSFNYHQLQLDIHEAYEEIYYGFLISDDNRKESKEEGVEITQAYKNSLALNLIYLYNKQKSSNKEAELFPLIRHNCINDNINTNAAKEYINRSQNKNEHTLIVSEQIQKSIDDKQKIEAYINTHIEIPVINRENKKPQPLHMLHQQSDIVDNTSIKSMKSIAKENLQNNNLSKAVDKKRHFQKFRNLIKRYF